MDNRINFVHERNIELMMEVIDRTDDFDIYEGKFLATTFDEVNGTTYIAVDNSKGCDFIIKEFRTQDEAITWLNGDLPFHI